MRITLALAALLTLGACASNTPAPDDYQELLADCQARGGILTPTGGTSSNERANYACEIRGGASPKMR